MLKKSNYENNGWELITNFEVLGIILIFSFVLYILFPGERILSYALTEKSNTELSELYLKNIYEKYPQKTDILFALLELYIKNNKINEAKRILPKQLFKDENINFKLQLLNIKLKIKNLEENDVDINEIYDFFIKSANKFSINNIDIVYEFNQKLIDLKRKKQSCSFMIDFFDNQTNKIIKKEIGLEYIRFLKRNLLISDCYLNVKKFEDFAINNDELSYEIIRLYLEAAKPNLASEFAYKVMKNKNII